MCPPLFMISWFMAWPVLLAPGHLAEVRVSSRSRLASQAQRYGASQASSSRSGSGRSRYSRRCSSTRASTSPASRSTRRCLETAGWLIDSASTSSPTDRSPSRTRSRIRRRRGSASTSNTALMPPACSIRHITVKACTDVARLLSRHGCRSPATCPDARVATSALRGGPAPGSDEVPRAGREGWTCPCDPGPVTRPAYCRSRCSSSWWIRSSATAMARNRTSSWPGATSTP